MNLTKQEKEIIQNINTLLETADVLLHRLSEETQEKIFQYHRDDYSLNHCIRWGAKASDDIIQYSREVN